MPTALTRLITGILLTTLVACATPTPATIAGVRPRHPVGTCATCWCTSGSKLR
jgi:hypothetical protein